MRNFLLAITALISLSAYADQTINLTCGDRAVIAAPACGAVTPSDPTPPPNNGGSGSSTTGWNGTCPGVDATRVITMNWAAPTRMYTRDVGGFGVNDAVVVQLTTGGVSTGGSLPRIAAAEYNSSPSSRIATLSTKPCDFGPQTTFGAAGEGNSVTMVFALGSGSGFSYYPIFALNTPIYLNMKNSPNSSCRANGACEMFIDLVKVGGL